jgi:hypothetical protein
MTISTAKELFLAGIEATEAERTARGAPVETEDLRQMVGLPPRRGTTSPPAATPPRPGGAGGCDKGKGRESVGGGPVTALSRTENSTKDVDVAIAELSRDGLSCRAIADELATMGMDVSYRTVARHLKTMTL